MSRLDVRANTDEHMSCRLSVADLVQHRSPGTRIIAAVFVVLWLRVPVLLCDIGDSVKSPKISFAAEVNEG